jgi:hypothetical protein
VNDAGVSNDTAGCGHQTTWLPLEWGPAPKGTKELNVYYGRYVYRGSGEDRQVEPTFGGLLVGLKPGLRSLPAANFPPGSFAVDYRPLHACSSHPPGEHILIEVFARPELGRVPVESLSKVFATALTEEALGAGPRVQSTVASKLIDGSLAIGRLTATFGSG